MRERGWGRKTRGRTNSISGSTSIQLQRHLHFKMILRFSKGGSGWVDANSVEGCPRKSKGNGRLSRAGDLPADGERDIMAPAQEFPSKFYCVYNSSVLLLVVLSHLGNILLGNNSSRKRFSETLYLGKNRLLGNTSKIVLLKYIVARK